MAIHNSIREVKLGWVLEKMTGFEIPFDEISVKESLIEDIRENGIKVPLEFLARADGHLRIIHGVHRLVAARRLKLRTVPVIIINGDGILR